MAGAPQASRVAELVKARKLPLLVSVNFDPAKRARRRLRRVRGDGRGGATQGDRGRQEEPGGAGEGGGPVRPRFRLRSRLPGRRAHRHRVRPLARGGAQAVTLDAAEALGIADRTGSLEAGKIANVVAWSGDPLTKEARAKLVFVDGRLHEPEERSEAKKDGHDRRGGSAMKAVGIVLSLALLRASAECARGRGEGHRGRDAPDRRPAGDDREGHRPRARRQDRGRGPRRRPCPRAPP